MKSKLADTVEKGTKIIGPTEPILKCNHWGRRTLRKWEGPLKWALQNSVLGRQRWGGTERDTVSRSKAVMSRAFPDQEWNSFQNKLLSLWFWEYSRWEESPEWLTMDYFPNLNIYIWFEIDWIWFKQIKFYLNNSITENFMPITLGRWDFDRKFSSTYQAFI